MRVLYIYAWVVITVGVTALSHERPKRHMSFIKKIVESLLGTQKSLHTDGHPNIYKVPGFEVILNLSPKQSMRETEIINQIKNLLSLEILSEKENDEIEREFIDPLTATKTKYVTEGKDNIYLIKSPVILTEMTNFWAEREPAAIEVPLKPSPVKMSEIYRPKNNYNKQTAQDGSITTLKSEGDQNIIVAKNEIVPALPPYIKYRLEQAVAKCITKIHCYPPISNNPPISYPRYEELDNPVSSTIVPSPYRITDTIIKPVPPPLIVDGDEHFDVVPDTFKESMYSPGFRVFKEANYPVEQDFDASFIVKEGNPITKKTIHTIYSKEGSKRVNVNVARNKDVEINKSSNESNHNKTNQDYKNLENINISFEGTITSNEINSNSESSSIANKYDNVEQNSSSYDIINEQANPRYSYNHEKHTVPAREEIKSKFVGDFINDYMSSLIENGPLNELNKRTRDDEDDNNRQTLFTTETLDTAEVEYSFTDLPIIVSDDTHYMQTQNDGSSVITRGNLQNVSIETNTSEDNDYISDIIF